MAAQKHFSQDDNITKEHSIKHYKKHTRTLVSRPNSPERENRQFVKQDNRSNVSESVATSTSGTSQAPYRCFKFFFVFFL